MDLQEYNASQVRFRIIIDHEQSFMAGNETDVLLFIPVPKTTTPHL